MENFIKGNVIQSKAVSNRNDNQSILTNHCSSSTVFQWTTDPNENTLDVM